MIGQTIVAALNVDQDRSAACYALKFVKRSDYRNVLICDTDIQIRTWDTTPPSGQDVRGACNTPDVRTAGIRPARLVVRQVTITLQSEGRIPPRL